MHSRCCVRESSRRPAHDAERLFCCQSDDALHVACGGCSPVDPQRSMETSKPDAAFECAPFEHPVREPVLLPDNCTITIADPGNESPDAPAQQ